MKHVPPLTGEPLDAPMLPGGITAQELPVAIGRLRKEARDEINRLIQFIDDTDNYVSRELEDDGDQADASYPESGSRVCSPMEDDEEAGDENEPSLGSTAAGEHASQGAWGSGNHDDREGDEHDGREPEHEDYDGRCDDEPSLGWTSAEAARGRGYAGVMGDGSRVDLEEQCEDEGAVFAFP